MAENRNSREVVPYYVDENVEHIGVSQLRQITAKHLREEQRLRVVCDGVKPLAVLLLYRQYLAMQRLLTVSNTVAE